MSFSRTTLELYTMNAETNESKSVKIGDIVDRLGQLENSADNLSDVKARSEILREWVKIIITVPSAVAVAVGLIIQLYDFLEYKNKSLELTLSKEILKLNEQLNVQDNKDMVRNAIFLLATMGPDAAPLLIYHIDDAGDDKSIVEAIGFGLKQIIEKNKNGDESKREERITDVLNFKVKEAISSQFIKGVRVPDLTVISNHTSVLVKAYSLINCPNDNRTDLNKYLIGVKQELLDIKEDLTERVKLTMAFDKGIEATTCLKT